MIARRLRAIKPSDGLEDVPRLTVPEHWRNVHQPVDETRLQAVCFGPLASETYIRRFFIALSVGGGSFLVRKVP